MTTDPFGTWGIRERVLAAWSASPVRFREDANAEEDYALGAYRDRLVVELAQNAADAAARSGRPGKLWLGLRRVPGTTDTTSTTGQEPAYSTASTAATTSSGAVLVAANTGEALDAAAVQSLATLRASAKTAEGQTVGRFGVGFAAVLAVTDEPAVLSRTGGVRFSAGDTRSLLTDAAATSPQLAAELARRGGHVPVLRLPFEAQGEPPLGYDTAVVLPLRDEAAVDVVLRRLDEVDDALLLALPSLAEIVIEVPGRPPRRLAQVEQRWIWLRRAGTFSSADLLDRPTEERGRRAWSLTWAVPRSVDTAGARSSTGLPEVLHAPTPTDEPLPWPAVLLATFPLDPGRRHVAAGAAADALVRVAGAAYADLLADLAASGRDVLPLVPTSLPAGWLDASLAQAVLPRLRSAMILASAEDPAVLLRPRDAVMIDGSPGQDAVVVDALASTVAGLVRVRRGEEAALRVLGVATMTLADVVDALPAHTDPARWRALYEALAPAAADAAVREALGALPVPLADGRLVRGARGVLLVPDASSDEATALAVLGIRAVHPEAAHTLLERLGAEPARPDVVLAGSVVRAAVRACPDADDPDEIADAVLTIVRAALADGRLRPDDLPWLGDLALRDEDEELAPASALVLPGSWAQDVLDPEEFAPVAAALLERWGPQVLRCVGVASDLRLIGVGERHLEPADEDDVVADLDGWDDYVEDVLDCLDSPDAVLAEGVAIADLDAVRTERWPDVLQRISDDPRLRAAVVEPFRFTTSAGSRTHLSYTAWWLRDQVCDGTLVSSPRAEDAVRALLPPAPEHLCGLDAGMQRALGVLGSLADLDASSLPAVLERLADPDRQLTAAQLLAIWRRLAALAPIGAAQAPPDAVRVLDGATTRLVSPQEAVVVEQPFLLGLSRVRAAVLAPPGRGEDLADLLDLPLAIDVVPGVVDEAHDAGQDSAVPAAIHVLVPNAARSWCEHDRLVVDGEEVSWWVDGSRRVHAATLDGLARGLAWQAGAWSRRLVLSAALTDPAGLIDLVVDEAFTAPDSEV